MANQYINVYMNNPTAGETDGTVVSTDGAFTAPFSFTLDAAQNESQALPAALRTESGYQTTGTTTISDNNDTNDRLKFCKTADGEFTDSITFEESITAVNTLFYIKASSADTENPQTDRSISIRINAVIASVG